jgi:hypothetical protein
MLGSVMWVNLLVLGNVGEAGSSPPPPMVVAPANGGEFAVRPRDVSPDRGRRLQIAGGATLGAGVLLAAVGFTGFATVHAVNPGPGLSIEDPDPAHARQTLRTARTMAAVGYAGIGTMGVGVALLIAGSSLRRAERRAARAQARTWRITPALGSVVLSGRF